MGFNKKFFTTGGIVASSAAPLTATDNFTPLIYTGNRVNSTTTNSLSVGFQPDLVWIKTRDEPYSHHLMDSVRGGDYVIYSNNSNAESGINNNFGGIDFVSDGITVKSSAYAVDNLNKLNDNYVAWCWKAGGTAVTDSSTGDISADISANIDAGFSIVSYTGSGNSGDTVPHGLSSTPQLTIIKNLDTSTNWDVSFDGISGGTSLNLDETNGVFSPTQGYHVAGASTLTLNDGGIGILRVNNLSDNYIAYCFHSVDGYQKIGSYSGGSTSTISTGFKPRFIIVKRTNRNGDDWHLFDSTREGSDSTDKILKPNKEDIESNGGADRTVNFTSDGFNWTNTNSNAVNASGGEYIYLAIA